jgi:sugar fermentation stimulation protein A
MNPSPISTKSKGLIWPELIPGTLIKRYKRFMADVRLKNGDVVTAHCPNTGSMQECCESGRPVYLSHHNRPNRKLKYTWELIEMPTSLVGINTSVPNQLAFQSVKAGIIEDLKGYNDVAKEIKTGNSRIDLLLTRDNNEQCYVEIKNCTLVKDGVAFFPDAITQRGRKHLTELQQLVNSGNRCVMFYLIQRMDANIFKPANHIDPTYGLELSRSVNNGVELLAYDVYIDLEMISLNRKIPIHIDGSLRIE